MPGKQNECDWFNWAEWKKRNPGEYDRYCLFGRRGTGKTTATKNIVASGEIQAAVWMAATLPQCSDIINGFVDPSLADKLPPVEDVESGEMPLFKFGAGHIRVVPFSRVKSIRNSGLDVAGMQPEIIVKDEAISIDGSYRRNEPQLLDDLAATVGRNGKQPKIIVIGNPIDNANPYAYGWRIDTLTEGPYTDRSGRSSVVIGTAYCKDCFNRKIGVDAVARKWAAHLDKGGEVFTVNGQGLRVLSLSHGWLYVGSAPPNGDILMAKNRYTPAVLTAKGTRFLSTLNELVLLDRIVFDGYLAELSLYEFLRLK